MVCEPFESFIHRIVQELFYLPYNISVNICSLLYYNTTRPNLRKCLLLLKFVKMVVAIVRVHVSVARFLAFIKSLGRKLRGYFREGLGICLEGMCEWFLARKEEGAHN